MGADQIDELADGTSRYRIELEGEVGVGLEQWLDVDWMQADRGLTVVEVTAVDQAQLQGLLRRLHDLHLRLVSLTRLGGLAEEDHTAAEDHHDEA